MSIVRPKDYQINRVISCNYPLCANIPATASRFSYSCHRYAVQCVFSCLTVGCVHAFDIHFTHDCVPATPTVLNNPRLNH